MTSIDEIERLHALHSAGALTDDEYRQEKERALSQLAAPQGSQIVKRGERWGLPKAAFASIIFASTCVAITLFSYDRGASQADNVIEPSHAVASNDEKSRLATMPSSSFAGRPDAAISWRAATNEEGRARNAFTIPDDDFSKYLTTYMIGPFKRARADFGFRTRFAEAERGGVNYAGHYAIVEIGCGTDCRTAYAIDGPTGQTIEFPLGGEEYAGLELSYAATSRLIKAYWPKDHSNRDSCLRSDYIIKSDQFRLLRHYGSPEACPSTLSI